MSVKQFQIGSVTFIVKEGSVIPKVKNNQFYYEWEIVTEKEKIPSGWGGLVKNSHSFEVYRQDNNGIWKSLIQGCEITQSTKWSEVLKSTPNIDAFFVKSDLITTKGDEQREVIFNTNSGFQLLVRVWKNKIKKPSVNVQVISTNTRGLEIGNQVDVVEKEGIPETLEAVCLIDVKFKKPTNIDDWFNS